MNRIGNNLVHFGGNEDLVRRLLHANVEFVVIGGLAIAWHCAARQADDMDLLVNPTSENSERIAAVLDELGLGGAGPDSFVTLGRQVTLKQVHYAELLTPERDGPQYPEIAASAVQAKLFNMPVLVASVASLRKLKQRALDAANAQRQKHETDLELLRNAV